MELNRQNGGNDQSLFSVGVEESQNAYLQLFSLGPFFPLSFQLSPLVIADRLQRFHDDWKTYNPKKPGFKRYGLSVTSLDGGLSGSPDLTSLGDYRAPDGTLIYNEMSFRKATPVYEAVPEIHPLIEPFKNFLGRSHFLKFMIGGFFPYHRDSYGPGPCTFRIFVPFFTHGARDFIFLLGEQRIHLESGRAYVINTRMEHALFVMDEPSISLVLNVLCCGQSVDQVHRMLMST